MVNPQPGEPRYVPVNDSIIAGDYTPERYAVLKLAVDGGVLIRQPYEFKHWFRAHPHDAEAIGVAHHKVTKIMKWLSHSGYFELPKWSRDRVTERPVTVSERGQRALVIWSRSVVQRRHN